MGAKAKRQPSDLDGYQFPVEDGTATVTGLAPGLRQYVTIVVARHDGTTYSSVRLAGTVRRHRTLIGS